MSAFTKALRGLVDVMEEQDKYVQEMENKLRPSTPWMDTYTCTSKNCGYVARITDQEGKEIFCGNSDIAEVIMAMKRKPGEVFHCNIL